MKLNHNQLRKILSAGVFFAFNLLLCQAVIAKKFDLPIRLVASADVLRLQYHRYSIREYLDIHNDDFNRTLYVNAITADSWIGHKRHLINENWLDGRRIIAVPPGKTVRIAERKRIVYGYARRDWWVRWIRFNVITDRGLFVSNFVSSPFKIPGYLETYLHQKNIDPLMEPTGITPHQKIEKEKGE